MSLGQEYRFKLTTPEKAVQIVKSGDWVDYGQFAAQANLLDRALAQRKTELWDVKVRGTSRNIGIPEIVKADPEGRHFVYHSHFFSAADRRLHDRGLCWHIPIYYHEVPTCYRRYLQVDVAMLAAAPMDGSGTFNFSTSVSFSKAICDKAKIVILEVNPRLPTCLGGREEGIHISEVDAIVEADWPVPQLSPAPPSEVDQRIAAKIMEELGDGCCLQLGIGGLPNAVGAMIARSNLKDLGIHTEMFVDSMVDMVEAGRITGARKKIDPGKIVYTFSLGTQRTYDFLHNNPLCAAYAVDYTNDPFVIQQNDRAASISNFIAVDLLGQVNSESYGSRHISGTGGQADFLWGASRSNGGKAFLCANSTKAVRDGSLRSRILPSLPPASAVTAHRSLVSYVVTEYGMVNLKGKSTWERAEDLISLAHPDFREELIRGAEEQRIWRRSNKIP